MAVRHEIAAQIEGEQDLKKLAAMLLNAVSDCEEAGAVPRVDPAIMVICYQIAFAGNGDLPQHDYYQRLLKYCKENASLPIPSELKIEPPYQPT